MPEGNPAEVPQPPKLSDVPDASKDINNMFARVRHQESQSGTEQGQRPEDRVETERFLGALPQELQRALRGFYLGVAKSIVSQQTRMSGDQAEVRVPPERVEYYIGRLNEVLDSGFFNPQLNPPKKITE